VVVPITRGLRYVTDEEPGIRRRGSKRFTYIDAVTQEEVEDTETVARIRAIAVPPAWTDVWICRDPDGHIQATGRDARGRKQYRYHADFRAERERTKFAELVDFGDRLGELRQKLDEDLSGGQPTFERTVALVVSLLECTHIRVGNECYVASNGTYGLTTLRSHHVAVRGSTVRIKFVGKGRQRHEVSVADRRIGRLIRTCQDLPGQLLFQWEDDDGILRAVTSTDVNDYLQAKTGLDVTAKTFRTWGATLLAAAGFAVLPPPTTTRRRNTAVKAVVEVVAEELRNTPTVARNSYIHPAVFTAYEDGSLHEIWATGPNRPRGGLIAEERRLLQLLAPRRRRRRQAA
jgi:DNA topoisomerase-1